MLRSSPARCRTRRRARVRRARPPERGAALVEAAILLPFLVLLVFGIYELSMVFRTASVGSNASRAGAREVAATYGNAADDASRRAVVDRVAVVVREALLERSSTDRPVQLTIYEATASGAPVDTSGVCDTSCFTYAWSTSSSDFLYQIGSWSDPVACGTTMDRVGVAVQLQHGGSLGPFRFTRPINERTVMRLEPSTLCG